MSDPHLGQEVAPVLDIGGGCKVEHVSTSYQGIYFLRKVARKVWRKIFLNLQEVHHLAGWRWVQGGHPAAHRELAGHRGAGRSKVNKGWGGRCWESIFLRVLVDMVFRVHEMQQRNPGERRRAVP